MKSPAPLVCICVPNYNNASTIGEMLDSLLAQTYQNMKIKVFDNASIDDSLAILRAYEKDNDNIEIFANVENIGGEANFEKCIEYMEGEFAAIYHSDDVYLPTMVETQVDFFFSHPECSAVATHGYKIDRFGNKIGQRFLPKVMRGDKHFIFNSQLALYKRILEFGNFVTCPSVMGRAGVYKDRIKSWNGKDYKTSADLDVWLRFADIGAFGFITQPLMLYRVSEASTSYSMSRMRTGGSDMFLVLNDYNSKPAIAEALTDYDRKNMAYLVHIDNVSRASTAFILGQPTKLKLHVFKPSVISCAVRHRQNFKFYIFGVLIVLIRPFLSVSIARRFLKYLKFRGN